MADSIRAFAATAPQSRLTPFSYDPGPLQPEQVEIAVTHCGICHSDLSMLNNDWQLTTYPFVPGHEVVGKVIAVGERVTQRKVGDTVGVGWYTQTCLTCRSCLSGDQNLCATPEQTIVGRHGGFAERLRSHWTWALPLPDGLEASKAGPLFCGGITVFNPLVQFNIQPTDRVGVVGIGGLGHMALQFLNKWGCEVVAFTSDSKKQEALQLGAHHAVNSRDTTSFKHWQGKLDMILVTVNVTLDWAAYLDCLAPRGRLHFVGAVAEPISVPVFPLIMGQKEMSGSPTGSIVNLTKMLEFSARHQLAPVTETFPLSKVNDALHHLESGKARYRIVLVNDLK